jgi:hypothetical protein
VAYGRLPGDRVLARSALAFMIEESLQRDSR